jgi:XTP/dITP diphosphohydrolase
MTTCLLATRNRHKVAEIQAVLGPAFVCHSLDDHPAAPVAVEDAATFAGNALKKATALARWLAASARPPEPAAPTGWVLADDSGLEVDALGGAPGVHSARFAALDSGRTGNSTDAENNAKLLRLLADVPPARRTARFHCAIALAPAILPPPEGNEVAAPARRELTAAPLVFEGVCEGRILGAARGTGGFGYDPLFQPDGYSETFAELGEATKNRISHRARALAALVSHLRRAGRAG